MQRKINLPECNFSKRWVWRIVFIRISLFALIRTEWNLAVLRKYFFLNELIALTKCIFSLLCKTVFFRIKQNFNLSNWFNRCSLVFYRINVHYVINFHFILCSNSIALILAFIKLNFTCQIVFVRIFWKFERNTLFIWRWNEKERNTQIHTKWIEALKRILTDCFKIEKINLISSINVSI